MTFLFAVIGIAAIAFLLWRAFGPQAADADERIERPMRRSSGPVGPDDDPDFLRDLDRRSRGANGTDGDDT